MAVSPIRQALMDAVDAHAGEFVLILLVFAVLAFFSVMVKYLLGGYAPKPKPIFDPKNQRAFEAENRRIAAINQSLLVRAQRRDFSPFSKSHPVNGESDAYRLKKQAQFHNDPLYVIVKEHRALISRRVYYTRRYDLKAIHAEQVRMVKEFKAASDEARKNATPPFKKRRNLVRAYYKKLATSKAKAKAAAVFTVAWQHQLEEADAANGPDYSTLPEYDEPIYDDSLTEEEWDAAAIG